VCRFVNPSPPSLEKGRRGWVFLGDWDRRASVLFRGGAIGFDGLRPKKSAAGKPTTLFFIIFITSEKSIISV